MLHMPIGFICFQLNSLDRFIGHILSQYNISLSTAGTKLLNKKPAGCCWWEDVSALELWHQCLMMQ